MEPEPCDFSLPASGLFVQGRELVKRDVKASAVVARIPIDRITHVDLVKRTEGMAIVFFLAFCGGAGTAWALIPHALARAVAAVALGAFALLCLLGARSLVLEVRSQDGPVRFEISDPVGHAEGFLVTLKGMKRDV